MFKNGQDKTNINEDSRVNLPQSKDRSSETNFLHRKIKETSKLLMRHRDKIEKMREQESALEEELRNLGRVVEKVEKYEQTTLPHISIPAPLEAKPEKVLA